MKKIIFSMLISLFILSFFGFSTIKASGEEKTINFCNSTFNGIRGEKFSTIIYVEEKSNVTGFDISLLYDEELVILDSYEVINASEVNVIDNKILINFSSANNVSEELELVKLTFILEDSLIEGSYDNWLKWSESDDDEAFTTDSFDNGIPNYSDLKIIESFTPLFIRQIGDAYNNNNDGKINSRDAAYILQHASHMFNMNDVDKYYANVYEDYDSNNNPKISARDASLILQYAAHIEGVEIGQRFIISFYEQNENGEYILSTQKSVKRNSQLIKIPSCNQGVWSLSKEELILPDFSSINSNLIVYAYLDETHIHNEVIDEKVEPTCTETGLTEGKHCSICTEVLVRQEVIPALGHDYIYHDQKSATCLEPGNEAYSTCTRCDFSTYKEIPATGHRYSEEWTFDDNYHWHAAICEHNTEVSNKEKHNLNDFDCVVCDYSEKVQLEAPSDIEIAYDVITWNGDSNSDYYTIRVNDNYTYTIRGTKCELNRVVNPEGQKILTMQAIKVEIWANEYENYLKSPITTLNSNYIYVPEYYTETSDLDKISNYKLGYGINLIETVDLVKDRAPMLAIFNTSKLMNIGEYTRQTATQGDGRAYSYSSVDDYISNSSTSFGFSYGVEYAPIGGLKGQVKSFADYSFSSHQYNETYVFESNVVKSNYYFQNIPDAYYEHCLSDEFVKVIMGQSDNTSSLTKEQLLEYIYKYYGTHAVVGMTTGASYVTSYVISTDSESYANKVRTQFELSAGGNETLGKVFSWNLGIDFNESQEYKHEESNTTAKYVINWTGSTGGSYASSDAIDSAIKSWSDKVNEENAVPVALMDNGGISIVSLIESINPELALEYQNYLDSKADDAYYELSKKYSKDVTSPIKTLKNESVDNKNINVVTIDLSRLQALTENITIDHINDSAFINGVYRLYPTMNGKDVDKIVIEGSFGSSEVTRNLIKGISFVLDKSWSRDIEIVFNNCGIVSSGFVSSSGLGIIDDSEIRKNLNVSISYEGANLLQLNDNEALYYVKNSDNEYNFKFIIEDGIQLDLSTANIENKLIYLPIASKDNYTFLGWETESITTDITTEVTDSTGLIYEELTFSSTIVELYPIFGPAVYRIVLENNGADPSTLGTDKIFEHFGEGFYKDYEGKESISKIVVPLKHGYSFMGYYSNENLCIDMNGNILTSTSLFVNDSTLYAKWEPIVTRIILNDNGCSDESSATKNIYIVYKQELYFDEECTSVYSNDLFKAPINQGYNFMGYADKEGNIIIAHNGIIENDVKNKLLLLTEDIELFAIWNEGIYTIELNHKNGFNDLNYYYYRYGVGSFKTIEDAENNVNKINSISVPERNGYVFNGYKDEAGNMVIDNKGNIIINNFTSNATIIADWSLVKLLVSFDSKGGTSVESIETTYFTASGERNTYSLPNEPTREGYVFKGWSYSDSDSTSIIDENTEILSMVNHTLYAQWKPNKINVVYTANDSSLGYVTVTPELTGNEYYYYDQVITLRAQANDNSEFINWSNGSESAELVITLKDDINIMANFKKKYYSVKFIYNGGVSEQLIVAGTSAVAPNVTDKGFAGWDKEFNNVTEDLVVNAIYLTGIEQNINISSTPGAIVGGLNTESPKIELFKFIPNYDRIYISTSHTILSYYAQIFTGMMQTYTKDADNTYVTFYIEQNGVIMSSSSSYSDSLVYVVPNIEVIIYAVLSHSYIDIDVDENGAVIGHYEGNLSYEVLYTKE